MRTQTLAAVVLVSACAFAQTEQSAPASRKSCDDLKAEISKKLDAKGVVGYTLEAVEKGKEGDAKVVGTCDGGTRSLTYTRGPAGDSKTADTKKPSAGN